MRQLLEWINLFRKIQTTEINKISPVHVKNRGIPVPKIGFDCSGCEHCVESCPTQAISKTKDTLEIDYGKCLLCGICSSECPSNILENSGFHHVFSTDRDELKIEFSRDQLKSKSTSTPTDRIKEFQDLTKGSGFLFREVSCGGNNAVECELNASFNSVFDLEQEGIRCVASPKHADVLVFTGPISQGMQEPLGSAWEVMPDPKALVACGTEAISGGIFSQGKPPRTPDLYLVGDPPRPDSILQAFRYLMGRISFSFPDALDFWRKKNSIGSP